LPSYPQSHEEGYAHIVAIHPDCDQAWIDQCASSLQYSLGEEFGGGAKAISNIFFNGAMMYHSTRICQGVKACEYLDTQHLKPHISVNEDSPEWAARAASFSAKQGNSAVYNAQLFYMKYRDARCTFINLRGGKSCSGHTCLRSVSTKLRGNGIGGHPYLGCSEEKVNQQHIFENQLGNYDIRLLIRLFGKSRTYLGDLKDYGGEEIYSQTFRWADGASSTCHCVLTNRQHGKYYLKSYFV
jgi:hypothetical protein